MSRDTVEGHHFHPAREKGALNNDASAESLAIPGELLPLAGLFKTFGVPSRATADTAGFLILSMDGGRAESTPTPRPAAAGRLSTGVTAGSTAAAGRRIGPPPLPTVTPLHLTP